MGGGWWVVSCGWRVEGCGWRCPSPQIPHPKSHTPHPKSQIPDPRSRLRLPGQDLDAVFSSNVEAILADPFPSFLGSAHFTALCRHLAQRSRLDEATPLEAIPLVKVEDGLLYTMQTAFNKLPLPLCLVPCCWDPTAVWAHSWDPIARGGGDPTVFAGSHRATGGYAAGGFADVLRQPLMGEAHWVQQEGGDR